MFNKKLNVFFHLELQLGLKVLRLQTTIFSTSQLQELEYEEGMNG